MFQNGGMVISQMTVAEIRFAYEQYGRNRSYGWEQDLLPVAYRVELNKRGEKLEE